MAKVLKVIAHHGLTPCSLEGPIAAYASGIRVLLMPQNVPRVGRGLNSPCTVMLIRRIH